MRMEKHENLVAALAAFHTEAVRIVKDATAKVTGENAKTGDRVTYTYGYADLATVAEAVNPVLGKHGLAFISLPTMTEQGFGLVYELAHESGESKEGFWPLPDPTRVKPQDMGSWITYWRRYALMSVTNTFPAGEDDDGAKASSRETWDQAQPRQQRQEQPPAAEKDWSKATDDEVHELHGRIENPNVPLANAVNGYDWMASKGLHKRPVQVAVTGGGDDGEGPLFVTATEVLAFRLADSVVTAEVGKETIDYAWACAESRGLMKILVSQSTTLGEELAMARDLLEKKTAGLINDAIASLPTG